ncbi:helix-turn-helix domain-containing protein [Chryseobacterium camelliae]|uniref:Helix-turn-helix domain-containing protein n=1 Tax=Chryseobacterium camelliae TaxID=1265445 RepID=A0ABY7QPI6_9FLAO|nr:helix-turn-helix domain-containing protein [Chryseobacterium camelliae]WBV61254.1 helix-turn-helix domain-containing protein [Chryseobacterium camelliae]
MTNYIEKNLEAEAKIKDHVVYIPLAGASEMENFRSPESYVFILFEKCNGIHSVDFVEFEEKDHQIHISFPGQIHSWKTDSSARGHKLIVSKEFIERYVTETQFSYLHINHFPVIDISIDDCERISKEFEALKKELDTEEIEWNIVYLRVQVLITQISNLLGKKIELSLNGNSHFLIRRFIDLIDLHYIESKSVAHYANLLAVSPNYLNILSKRYLGISAKSTIDRRVVLEAKRFLLGSEYSVKEVASKLGFESSISFVSYFYKKTGFYPQKYRKSNIEKDNAV